MTATMAAAATGAATSGPGRLELVAAVAEGLEARGIACCHWKSTEAMDRSETGDNDLDLLVRRADAGAFRELLACLGFVRGAKPGAEVPGIESFFGHDVASGRLVHVHAHYALVIGDDRTKNYRLPIEAPYIASAGRQGLFRLPAAELELAVLVLRLVLKYCAWDAIAWSALRGRRAAPARGERRELVHLLSRADAGLAGALLTRHAPYVSRELFAACYAALSPDAGLARRLSAGRRLERALQPFARRSRPVDAVLKTLRRMAVAIRRRGGGLARNRPAGGGLMIGVMGGDGAGKSTAIAGLATWLGSEFDVHTVHLGKPRWSPTTRAVRGALKVALATLDAPARLTRRPLGSAERLRESRQAVWWACMARDRRLAHARARREVARGRVVICDRYPHPRLPTTDGPRIGAARGSHPAGRLGRWLMRREEREHQSIAPPDLLVVLRVDPEIAVLRKTDEDAETVRRRGREVWSADWSGTGVRVVDASRPAGEVAAALRAAVWEVLA